MATVRKRTWKSGGAIKTAWIADYFHQGKRHIKTFERKKDADDWLAETQIEVKRGVHTPERDSITVAEAAEIWIEKGALEKLERSTLRQYRNHVDLHIKPSRIGTEKLARLSTPVTEAFRDDLLKKCSRPMARKVLASLKSILGEAQRRGLVAHNAAQPVKVDVKKRDQRKLAVGRDIPSKEEIQTILSKAEDRWRPLLITAIFTGMRASELRGLTWDDVDFERKVVHVRQRANLWGEIGAPKSAAGHREIPTSPMVANALKEWKLTCPRLQESEDAKTGRLWLVFPNGNGNVENHANLANRGFYSLQLTTGIVELDDKGKPVLEPVCDKDGRSILDENGNPVMKMKPKYGMHALRHFFASWAIERGFSPKRLQALLGHSSIQMTFDVYGHLFPSLEDDHAKFAAGELAVVGC
jgi:integrase